MKYTRFPKTDLKVSVIGMGCWGLGGQYGEVEEATAIRALEHAHEVGINFYDTADAYGVTPGTSETLMGKVLPRFRDEVFIASKVGNLARRQGHPFSYEHPSHIINCCDASLYRLRTDTLDFYQCHISAQRDPDIFLEAFEILQRQGKIRYFGVSTPHPEVLSAFNRDGKCTVCQIPYNVFEREAEAKNLAYAQEHGIGTLMRSPLLAGVLTGKFTKETVFTDQVRTGWGWNPGGQCREQFLHWIDLVDTLRFMAEEKRPLTALALQFVLAHPAATLVIPGAKSPQQIDQHIQALDTELKAEELAFIRDLPVGDDSP